MDNDMRRFVGYRPGAAALGKHGPGQLAPPDQPQYEGIVFTDGSVALRWRTAFRSTSTWADFENFYRVHGHPEYGTVIDWPDGCPDSAQAVIDAVAAEGVPAGALAMQRQQRIEAAVRDVLDGVYAGSVAAEHESLRAAMEG